MLARFNNEVLSYGPAAVLPQNLNNVWLNVLQDKADEFLDSQFELDECRRPKGDADPLLTTCVIELVRYQEGTIVELSNDELLDKVTLFAVSLTMETARRESNFDVDPPSLENILEWSRVYDVQSDRPEFIDVLEKACILRKPKQNWIKNLRARFTGKLSESKVS
ncbi:hypothetical protein D3OALGA1CA_1600 [Olavius algarvensis associated proteobacterium Delta 3]|nr:hypothetical protein D3OALGB2SA_399 [Olavius algarvensis associated proteobacterium Delta 3]CAB5103644.1 hypothetical protein D3OALGA1CA_1600 [Olavius algarvensis associated proteobacterium Delta 3]